MDKSIIRVQKGQENPYVMIDKRIFIDAGLSWKAKGILGYLLSKPDDWTIMVVDLIKQSTDGRDSVYSGLKELAACGYVKRMDLRDNRGRLSGCEYLVHENPQNVAI